MTLTQKAFTTIHSYDMSKGINTDTAGSCNLYVVYTWLIGASSLPI